MGNIKYSIISGVSPFIVSLNNNAIPNNIHEDIGEYYFENIQDGTYKLTVVDSNNCGFEENNIIVNSSNPIGTKYNVIIPDKLIVGNSWSVENTFNKKTTNRNGKYVLSNGKCLLYLWLKSSNNKPLSNDRVIRYVISNGENVSFVNIDGYNVNKIEHNIDISSNEGFISGTLILKAGTIECCLVYEIKSIAQLQIFLYSDISCFDTTIPVTDTNKIYGIKTLLEDYVEMKY